MSDWAVLEFSKTLPWQGILVVIQAIAVVLSVFYAAKAVGAANSNVMAQAAAHADDKKARLITRIENLLSRITYVWERANEKHVSPSAMAELKALISVAEFSISTFTKYELPKCCALAKAKKANEIASLSPQAIDELQTALEETVSPMLKLSKYYYDQMKQ